MIRILGQILTFILLTGCFSEEGGDSSGGGLFIGHKESTNNISITLPSNQTYGENDILTFTVTHPDNMTITAPNPSISIDIGGSTVNATLTAGDGTKNLTFQYTVVAGNDDLDGITINSIDLNGGSIDFTGGAVDLTLPSIDTSGILVSTSPLVTIANPIVADIVNISNNTTTYVVVGTCNQSATTVNITLDSNPVTSPTGFVCDGSSYSGSFDISAETDGTLLLEAELSGTMSNSVTIVKDTIAPTLTITSNPNITFLNNTNYSISGDCDEAGATVNVDIGTFLNNTTCDGTNWSITGWDLSLLSDAPTIAVNVDYEDAAGNSASDVSAISKNADFTVAITSAPTINIANSSTYTVSGTCSDDGTSVDLDIGAGTVTDSFTCTGGAFSFTVNASAAGDNVALAVQVTHGGATDTNNVLKDTIAPALAITPAAADIDNLNVASYSIAGTCDEASATVTVNLGAITNTATCDGTNWSITGWDVSAEADNTGIAVSADMSDAAGNPATQATDSVDKLTPETVAITTADAINIANSTAYTVSGTCSDDGTNVALDIGAGTVTDNFICAGNAFSFSVNVSAIIDNASVALQVTHGVASDSTNVLKDTIAPALAITPAAADIDNLNEASYSIVGTCDEASATVTVNLGGLSNTATCDGTNWSITGWDVSAEADNTGIAVTADMDDAAGNPATQATDSVDKTTPETVAIVTATTINIANVTSYVVDGTCSDDGTNVALDIGAGTVTDSFVCTGGAFNFSVDTTLVGDNTSVALQVTHGVASDSTNVLKDTIAPALAITPAAADIDNLNEASYSIAGTCDEASATVTVNLGGLSNTATCDGTNWSITGWDVSAELDNTGIAVSADMSDAAGNPATQATDSVDKLTPETVTIVTAATINITNVSTYIVDGTCSDNGTNVALDIGAGTVTDNFVCAAGAFSFSVNTSSVLDNASVAVQVTHGVASDSTNVLKDTIAPALAITPAAADIDAVNETNYSIAGTCDETSATVTVNLGGLSNTATCDGTNWSITGWDISGEADNTGIAVSADMSDAAGNPATQATDSVDKNTVVHNVSITSSLAINSSNVSAYDVSGTCSVNGDNVSLDIASATVTDTIVCTGGAFSFTVNASAVGDNASVPVQVTHGAASDSTSVLKDVVVPTLDSNSITANSYSLGNAIQITVNFSENVIILGNPRIELNFESQSNSPIYATVTGGNGTSSLTFEYTVASGDNDANGIDLVAALEMTASSIRDAAGNDAGSTLATTNFPSVFVDSAAPYITSFVEPANGTYADGGGELLFQVNFSENVTVTGSPQISINLGGSTVVATYKSGSTTAGLEFSYLIQPGDNDADGVTLNSSTIQNGGIVATSDSDPSALEFGTYLDSMAGVLVDTASGITAPNQVTGVTTAPTTNNTELSVAWQVPNDNGTAIINYSVQYRQQGTSTWLNSTPAPSNSTTIGGLSAGITYEIRVAANNGLLGPYSATSTAEIFDVLALNPVAWLSSTNITNGGSEPTNGTLIDQWEDLTGAASAATEANTARQPTYETNAQNGLPAVRFDNLDRGLEGTFSRAVGTDLTFIVVGQFDNGSTDKCLFEFDGGGGARGFFIDRRYASNNQYTPALTRGSFQLWRIEDSGGNATVTEGGSTQLYSGGTNFNTDFTGTGNYVLGDDITGGNRMNGYIGEFLVFDRALTPAEISTLETYLINKWGL